MVARQDPPVLSTFERVGLQITSCLDLDQVLGTVTEGLVDTLGACFARIWLVGPGDRCGDCGLRARCPSQDDCLHLRASAGIHTHLDGSHARVPIGALKIGHIAADRTPIVSHELQLDPRVPDKVWVQRHGLKAFAGYPLEFGTELLGVLGVFADHQLPPGYLERLGLFARQASIAIKNAQLFETVDRLRARTEIENTQLKEELRARPGLSAAVVGEAPSFRRVMDQVRQVAPTGVTVLVTGETGTGKEVVARAVHRLSGRSDGPLVKVNCAAINSSLLESELFGHERGAFTGATERRAGRFELADGGTIFLDEIGEMSLDAQAKLLRVLQEREVERVGSGRPVPVDVRVVAATNRNLRDDVAAGRFREDLYYRLETFPIRLPPLRDRREDIEGLGQYFVQRFAQNHGRTLRGLSARAVAQLQSYPWPGNIRELQNVVERACILSPGVEVEVDAALSMRLDGPPAPRAPPAAMAPPPTAPAAATPVTPVTPVASPEDTLEAVERRHISQVLDDTRWVIGGAQGAARRLGLKPSTLRSRMKRLGIERP